MEEMGTIQHKKHVWHFFLLKLRHHGPNLGKFGQISDIMKYSSHTPENWYVG